MKAVAQMGLNNDCAVQLEGVSKKFGSFQAVNPIDLAVPTGSIYGFIGPNGSGKTTTMRMILRIYQPDSGRVRVLGAEHGSCADDRVGYLPEERGLYRRMTVRRVLRYMAKIKGCTNPDPEIDRWMEKLGATDWYKKRIDQLSKGMAQKVQFVATVVSKPQLVILDEPFSGLDPVNMEVLRDAVMELRANGTTVIFSTHDMSMAEQMCDSICMIFRGNKVLDGRLGEVKSQYGEPRLRVALAGGQDLPTDLPGVTETISASPFTDLVLESGASKQAILRRLMDVGEVTHFENRLPSLHDIFVRIAQPTDHVSVA
ncbi:MAG: ABC transporter ATP-binding protein [Pirellula sp.]|jgi:ABC-2 type transport system ATP-binding protein